MRFAIIAQTWIDILMWLTSKSLWSISFQWTLKRINLLWLLNCLFGFGNNIFADYTIVIVYLIAYVRISITYSYTVSINVKNLYKSHAYTVSYTVCFLITTMVSYFLRWIMLICHWIESTWSVHFYRKKTQSDVIVTSLLCHKITSNDTKEIRRIEILYLLKWCHC